MAYGHIFIQGHAGTLKQCSSRGRGGGLHSPHTQGYHNSLPTNCQKLTPKAPREIERRNRSFPFVAIGPTHQPPFYGSECSERHKLLTKSETISPPTGTKLTYHVRRMVAYKELSRSCAKLKKKKGSSIQPLLDTKPIQKH